MYSFYIFLTIVVAGTITKGVEIGTFPVPTDFKVPPYKLRHIWSGVHLGINFTIELMIPGFLVLRTGTSTFVAKAR